MMDFAMRRRRIKKFGRRRWTTNRAPKCLGVVLLCTLVFGCRDVETIWSTESRSPDGQWVASAQTEQYGGPGTAGIETSVFLQSVKGPQDKIRILELSQGATSVDLTLRWLSSTHLEVTYRRPATINFQAIKSGGIDISVREVS
jgi:hypothetical protein